VWLYKGQSFDPDTVEDYFGFVYEIRNLIDGRVYLGKKLFSRAKTLGPKKGKKNKRRSRVDSDWQTYYGSNKELQKDVKHYGEENFEREILFLCKTRGECSYLELREQMLRDVLRKPEIYYNAYVGARVSRSHLPAPS